MYLTRRHGRCSVDTSTSASGALRLVDAQESPFDVCRSQRFVELKIPSIPQANRQTPLLSSPLPYTPPRIIPSWSQMTREKGATRVPVRPKLVYFLCRRKGCTNLIACRCWR